MVQVMRFACKEWRCFLLTLLNLFCLISLIWCINLVRLSAKELCQPVHYSLAAMMLFLLYLIYLFECLNCRTRLELATATDFNQMSSLLTAAVKHDPKLWWLCFSYHYIRSRRRRCHCRPRYTEEVRFSTTMENGIRSGGESAPETETHDRVITSAKQHFIAESAALKSVWRDKSPQINWDDGWEGPVHLKFVKEFIFADEATRLQYEMHKRNFMKLQESCDDFMEIKEGKLSQELKFPFQSHPKTLKCKLICE